MSAVEPPFPNKYRSRLVAEADLRSCTVCFKFTTTVLLADNKGDFFYICPAHLKDTNFCDPIHTEEYLGWIRERDALCKKIADLKKKIDDAAWNKYLPTKWMGKKEKDKKEDGDDKDEKEESKKAEKTDEMLMRQKNKDLDELLEKIAAYQCKDFKLNKDVYRMRLQRQHRQKVQAKRLQEIQSNPGFFPQVPTNDLGSKL